MNADGNSGLMFPKLPPAKAKMKHPKSILHDKKDRTCYLCMKLEDNSSPHLILEEHHIFGGTANRKLSEEYGLKVYLCLRHHTDGPQAVHNNKTVIEYLHRVGQRAFENQIGTREEFMEIFGRNYL